MKLILFTPVNSRSAIGRVSALLASEIVSKGVELVIVASDDINCIATHDFNLEILDWKNEESIELAIRDADACLYQIGNHYPYHEGCIHWMQRKSGIIILHDFILGHLFWGWSESIGRDIASSVLADLYGEKISREFWVQNNTDEFMSFCIAKSTCMEWVLGNADVVISHSDWGLESIRKAGLLPSVVLHLPYNAIKFDDSSKQIKKKDGKFNVLTFGDVNPNKRYESIIHAISNDSELRAASVFRIIGNVEDETKSILTKLASEKGVDVRIFGSVDDETLSFEITNADVICCLRYPALESASASTIEALLYAKPVIVTDTGFYSGLPDNIVFKISQEDELNGISKALRYIFKSPEECAIIARNAKSYALETFNAKRYASDLLWVVNKAPNYQFVKTISHEIALVLSSWNVNQNSDLLKPLFEKMELLDLN